MFKFFESRIDPFPDTTPTRPPSNLPGFIWHYTKDIWPWLAVMIALVAGLAIVEISLFGFLGNIIDWLSEVDRATFWAQNKSQLIFMAFVLLGVLPALSVAVSLVIHQVILVNFPMRIRWLGHRYMLKQSYEFYADEFAGRIATKVMQGALAIRETVMKLADIGTYVGVYFLGALVLFASFAPIFLIPMVGWLLAYSALLRILLPRLTRVAQRQADARSTMTGRVVDSYTNILTAKLFAHAGREEAYAKDSMIGFLKTGRDQMRLSTALDLSVDFINILLTFTIFAIGIFGWLNDTVSVGAFAAAVALVLRLNGMSHWIMWEMVALFENIGTARDAMNTIARDVSVADIPNATELNVTKGEIKFDHLKFHYGKQSGVLEDFSLTVKPGQKIGLVGRSGAGKTTLTNVLLRLYDIDGGTVSIDGQDISKVSQNSLRRQIGVVTQDTSLLHRSIADNIAYGRQEASIEEVIQAAKRANAHDFILDLEDFAGRKAYEAHVGERGVKLSGGQRQRVAIARMFLKDAPILILDEATSALDSEVEAAIQENLLALMEGKTVIAIAHRLSTIAALDKLIVLDAGKIVQQGTHATLSKKKGLYAELWARQSGGFIARNRQKKSG